MGLLDKLINKATNAAVGAGLDKIKEMASGKLGDTLKQFMPDASKPKDNGELKLNVDKMNYPNYDLSKPKGKCVSCKWLKEVKPKMWFCQNQNCSHKFEFISYTGKITKYPLGYQDEPCYEEGE